MLIRRIAMVYLPTVGLWSLIRAIQFHRCGAARLTSPGQRGIVRPNSNRK